MLTAAIPYGPWASSASAYSIARSPVPASSTSAASCGIAKVGLPASGEAPA